MRKTRAAVVGLVVLVLIGGALLLASRDELHWRWAASRDEVQDYESYLTSWPDGRHAPLARTRHDDRSWAIALSDRTIEGCRQYEIAYPKGAHLDKARARIEQLAWAQATSDNTVQSLQTYVEAYPNGAHLVEARTQAEEITWRQATGDNTVRSLQTYVEAYPQGQFVADARTRQEVLRADDRPFSAATKLSTETALLQFLADFPGHVKEGAVRLALKDVTEGRDIVDLLEEKKVEIETQGGGIQSVIVRVRKLVPHPLTVRIPVGSYFDSENLTSQNMVTTAEKRIVLQTDNWERVHVPAACANRLLNIPGSGDRFTIERSSHQGELAALIPVLDQAGADFPTRQAAVWIVTDDATDAEIGTLIRPNALYGDDRVITSSHVTQAVVICARAGIDVTRKRVWRDKSDLLKGLDDQNVKNWVQQQRASLIAALLKDQNVKARREAVRELGRRQETWTLDPLIAALTDSDAGVRESAVYGLSKHSDSRAVEPLIAALKDNEASVRCTAADVLRNYKDSRTVQPLIALLQDPHVATRISTAGTLGQIGDRRAVEPLIHMLSNDRDARWAAANGLGFLKDKRAIEPLVQALQADKKDQGNYALALGRLGDVRAVQPLVELLQAEVKEASGVTSPGNLEVAAVTVDILGSLKDQRAVEVLITALEIDDWDFRGKCAEALAEIGDSRAVEPLIRMFDDRSGFPPVERISRALSKLTGDTNVQTKQDAGGNIVIDHDRREEIIAYWLSRSQRH